MSKNYRNYVGIVSAFANYEKRRTLGGIFNFFDVSLDSGGIINATGGTTIQSNNIKYHVFTAPGNFTVLYSSNNPVQYLIVGAGGNANAASDMAGGGGGGGVRTGSTTITNTTYPITVGAGGGNSSSAFSLTSGGGENAPRSSGGVSGTPQANAGGLAYPYGGSPPGIVNGGGGGAGGTGTNGGLNSGGSGGPGTPVSDFPGPIISAALPSPVQTAFSNAVGPTGLFGGGGGAGTYLNATNTLGGPGGGGAGGVNPIGTSGVQFTGGGAGGASANQPAVSQPRTGGDGLVVIRYGI